MAAAWAKKKPLTMTVSGFFQIKWSV